MNSNNIFGIILYFIKKYKFSILFFAVFAYLLRDILNLCINSYIYKELINKLTDNNFSFKKDVFIFISYILTINSGVLLSILTTKAEYNFRVKLKEDIKNYYFQKTLKHSIRFFNDNMAGTINSKIRTLSNDIVELLLLVIEIFSISITILILIFIFTKTNYMLSIILLVWFLFYGGGSIFFMKKIGLKVKARTKIENESYGRLTDSLVNILSVKIFSMEKYEKRELKKQTIDIKKENTNYFIFLTFQKIFDYFGILAIILPVSYLTISMKIENKINIGELVFIFSVFGSIVWWLRYLARNFIRVSEYHGSIGESLNVINIIPDIRDIDGSKNITLKTSPKIEFNNIVFKYKENLPIVFENFNGNSYGCNPKYIAEEIIRRNLPYDLVWLVRSVTKEKEKNVFPEQIRLVGYGSKQALKELASAKIWIDNKIDFTKNSSLIIAAVSLIMGAGNFSVHIGSFDLGGIGTATLAAILLNLFLNFLKQVLLYHH